MAKAKKKSAKRPPAYLTKRILASAAQAGVRNAAIETMKVMGYIVIAHRGWVVRKYQDGYIERISPLETVNANGSLTLD
jgi:hypothetical protein